MSIWSIWTNPQATIDLKQCIADEISANDTAAILSVKYRPVSRSACIGRAWRQKLKFCSEQEHRKPRMRKKYARFKTAAGSPIDPRSLPSMSQADDEIPVEQRKRLLELTNTTCRYPIGETNSPMFFYCGAPEAYCSGGMPYCARHASIAYGGQRSPTQALSAEAVRLRGRRARAVAIEAVLSA